MEAYPAEHDRLLMKLRVTINIEENKRESVMRTWIQRNGVAPLLFLKAKDEGFVNIQIDIKPDDRESLLFVQAVIRTTGCKVHQQQVD